MVLTDKARMSFRYYSVSEGLETSNLIDQTGRYNPSKTYVLSPCQNPFDRPKKQTTNGLQARVGPSLF